MAPNGDFLTVEMGRYAIFVPATIGRGRSGILAHLTAYYPAERGSLPHLCTALVCERQNGWMKHLVTDDRCWSHTPPTYGEGS